MARSTELKNPRCVPVTDHFSFVRVDVQGVEKADRALHPAALWKEVVGAEDKMFDADQVTRAIERTAIPA